MIPMPRIHSTFCFASCALILAAAFALPAPRAEAAPAKKTSGTIATNATNPKRTAPLIVLVGDSTVTGRTPGKDLAGWGWALEQWTRQGAKVENAAISGRSSRSFRDQGYWDKAIALKPDWVLIQFGHNDQIGKGPSRESDPETAYRDHLRRYITEVRALGGRAVLVTPVCRRTYNSDGVLTDKLADYAKAVHIVGKEMQVPVLDLHRYSFEKLSKMTPEESAAAFTPSDNPSDRTHFSTKGSQEVAAWVLEMMQQEVPELAAYFTQPTRNSR